LISRRGKESKKKEKGAVRSRGLFLEVKSARRGAAEVKEG